MILIEKVSIFGVSLAMGILSTVSAFQLYPFVAPEVMAQMLGISSACITALNITLPCDNDLFQWTQKVDQVYWQEVDVTRLCKTDCISSVGDWKTQVESACMNDYVRSGDRYVPADTISGHFIEGLKMACMRSSSNEWCLPESYNWVGSDVVQIDCDIFPTDSWCLNRADPSPENSRISALYDDDLLCSECFLKILYARVTSDFLPDTDFSDYLVNEFQDIQNVCQTTIGELVTRVVPGYLHITDGYEIGISTALPTTTNDPTPTSTACAGRVVDICPDREAGLTCHDIADKYEQASGEFIVATKSEYCDSTGPICIPSTCTLYVVAANETCESIAHSLSNTTTEVSLTQIASWNPYILGACDHLAVGQRICSGPPGGAWISPPDSEIPDNGNGPVRGGPGSTVSLPIIEDPDAVPVDRVQKGMPPNCSRWVVANTTTASCWKIANDGKISQQQLWQLNPVLGGSGENCIAQVWLGYYYCVATKGNGTANPGPMLTITSNLTSTVTPTPSAASMSIANMTSASMSITNTTTFTMSSAALPKQTQAGFPLNCRKYVQARSGASCWSLANDNRIEVEQLYKLNPVLGLNGENCETQIWVGYYYCIAV